MVVVSPTVLCERTPVTSSTVTTAVSTVRVMVAWPMPSGSSVFILIWTSTLPPTGTSAALPMLTEVPGSASATGVAASTRANTSTRPIRNLLQIIIVILPLTTLQRVFLNRPVLFIEHSSGFLPHCNLHTYSYTRQLALSLLYFSLLTRFYENLENIAYSPVCSTKPGRCIGAGYFLLGDTLRPPPEGKHLNSLSYCHSELVSESQG